MYGDLNWFDAPNDVKMSVYIKNRIIPQGEKLTCQLILWNRSASSISANVYLDINNSGDLKCCTQDKMNDIQPGNIAYDMWTLGTDKRSVGDHQIGFFCEPKSGAYYGKTAGRYALGALVGIRPGKSVGGFSTKYRIVNGIDCPQCKKSLLWKKEPKTGWYCDHCDGWL
ncbi:MAG: hypothetical protein KKH41_01790 [Candidatus Thermoplasmatota archaeon]|nr:hypothetical protein [Euryarchaeota archaeon]MBU4033073.1 hypothetical protein [Candidatus Thermoplasmatota archaeon]MBU4072335.1 hypothetical protein [Candidatus Thermoplasmatota archaeon]MBU4143633.1 hypothetical protein [Candidatus Thermoplasmatota archaeon]MBU4591293.1 hypothetical protein [Candidatus Thermoplasmatota archaeon]